MLNPNDIFAQIGFVVDSSPLKSSRKYSKNKNDQQYSPQKQIFSEHLSPERQHRIPQYITTLEIELNEDENHTLQIKSFDDPYQIAYDFCHSHNLNLLAVEVVEKKIIEAKRREELKLKFLKQAQIEDEKQSFQESFDRKYSNPKQLLPHNNCNQDFMRNTQMTKKKEDLSRSIVSSKLSKQLSASKINKNQRNSKQKESNKDEKAIKKLDHKESQAILSRACQSLYLRGKQKTKELQQKRMKRKQQLQQKQAQEYTFKPKLNEVSEKIIEFRKQTGTVAPRNVSKAKQQATGQMYKQLQECTFTPQINPISKIIVHNRESYLNQLQHFQENFNCQEEESRDISLPKRKPLNSIPSNHSFCNRKSKQYLLKQKQLQDKELFKPKLNPRSIQQVKESFYDRLEKAIETKQRIKQGEYKNDQYSFQPQIGRSPLYQALRGQNAINNKENVPVWEVLYKEGQSRIKEKQKLQENKSRNELITSISRHDLQHSGFNNQSKNQLNITAVKASTNLHYENLIQKRINCVFQLLDSDGDGLVSPNRIGIENLSKNTLIFLKPIFEEMDELDEQLSFTQFRKAVINLLNDSDTYKKGLFLSDNKRTQNQFTFTPSINPKSKELAEGRNTSQIHIGLYEQGIKNLKRKEMYIQMQKAKKQQMELQECSFKPCLHLGRKEYHPSILDRKLSDIQFSVNQSNNSHLFFESQMSKLNRQNSHSIRDSLIFYDQFFSLIRTYQCLQILILQGLDSLITNRNFVQQDLKTLINSKERGNMLHQVYLLLQKTEGRDKLTKFLIYLFKFIDATKSIYSSNQTYELEKIAHNLQKARQFMRLAKFIPQFSRIIKLMKQPTKDQYRRLVQIIIHTFFSFYWVLDNLCLLSAFNIIQAPQFQLSQTQMTIKVIALTIAAVLNLRNWIKLHHQEIKARKMLKVLKGEQNLKKNVELLSLIKQQWKMFLLCVKIYGDILPSFAKSTFAKKTLKVQIPRIIQALGGLINAIVSCFLTSM